MTNSARKIHRFKMRLRRVRHRFWKSGITWTRTEGLAGGVRYKLVHGNITAIVADASIMSYWSVDDAPFHAHAECLPHVGLALVAASEIVLTRISIRAKDAENALAS